MKSLYILIFALFISAVSCRTKDGAPGPAGDNGLTQQGSISAQIAFIDSSGNNAVKSLNYQYYASLSDSKFYYEVNGSASYYDVSFTRKDIKDNYNYISIDLVGNGLNELEYDPFYTHMNFHFVTLVNNEIVEFYSDGGVTITNVNLDSTTGRLTFDYTGSAYYNNGNQTATVTGKVDVIMNRLPRRPFYG